mmetsp:Transcript_26878/g.58781  ORF Transcript_26878/g.58781 Transcript_26878/m.58781 type:complete len:575 (-) Transcript_26878:170-1894(-)
MLSYLFLRKQPSSPSKSSPSTPADQICNPSRSTALTDRTDDVNQYNHAAASNTTPSSEPFVLDGMIGKRSPGSDDSAIVFLKKVDAASSLLPDYNGVDTARVPVAQPDNDNDSQHFYDADNISVLDEGGAEDNASKADDNATAFMSCTSRAESRVTDANRQEPSVSITFDIPQSLSTNSADDALLDQPIQLNRSHSNVSVLSSASAVSYYTANSFHTAATHLSSGHASLRTMNTKESYATALSRMSTKTDKVFVLMPQRLIRSGHVNEGMSVLGDTRYLAERIQKLGATLAAELMAADCQCLERRALVAKNGSANDAGAADMAHLKGLSTQSAAAAKVILLFDTFRRQVVASCVGTASIHSNKDTVSTAEGGRALFMLGTSLDRRGMVSKAMTYYRSALRLFLSEMSEPGASWMGAGNVDYDAIDKPTKEEEKSPSTKPEAGSKLPVDDIHIARTLVYLGDLHEKKDELEDALKAFHAAVPYFEQAIDTSSCELFTMTEQGEDTSALNNAVDDTQIELFFVLARMGGLYRRKNDIGNALQCFDIIVHKGTAELGQDHVLVKLALISVESTKSSA